jgi:hypothetical protein
MATSQHGKYLNTNGSQTQFIGLFECHDLSPNGFYRILLRFFYFRSVCLSKKHLHKLSRQGSFWPIFPVSCEATATPLDDFESNPMRLS